MNAANEVLLETHLIRGRDTLVVYASFCPLLEDLDFHLLSLGIQHDALTRQILGDGLTALGLHLATRPVEEYVGWTVSIQKPMMNLFFTGTADTGCIVGRAFLDGVEPRPDNVFISQSKRDVGEPQLSNISVAGIDVFAMVEQFYEQSEQKVGRFFHRELDHAFLLSLPGAKREWLEQVETDEVFEQRACSRVEHLSTRPLHFRCGCDAGILVGAHGRSPEALFSEDREVEVECPRCAATILVNREDYENLLREG